MIFEELHLLLQYRPDKEARLIRLYDNEYCHMSGPWLFDQPTVAGLSAEQLQAALKLPFLPRYLCDAIVAPENIIKVYAIAGTKFKTYHATSGVSFLNETMLPSGPKNSR